jgi:DNA uptake protein ComE-like DNA-binding protein
VLVIVLVVVVLLALAAYNYSQLMLNEMEAARVHVSDVQARMVTDSAAEYVATLLANRTEPGLENLQHNPQLFQGVLVMDSEQARGRCRFSIIAPLEQDASATRIRYGLMDESARLNLNVIGKLQLEEDQQRELLMGLPGMTEDIADAILDWIDADDNARPYGAEAEYYESEAAYSAKNGPLETIDELLLVRGVTPELLYGEDANRNGLLDANEDDADASPPLDNADGILQLGWIANLTVHSREANLRADGSEKIDVNNGLLTDLYDQLAEEFDEETATFIIAYRMAGAKDPNPNAETQDGSGGSEGSGGTGGSGGSGGNANQSGGRSSASSTTRGQQQQAQQEAVQGIAAGIAEATMSPGGKVTRGGMDISKGGQVKIKSLWELIGSRTDATINGAKITLESPWPEDAGSLQSTLPTLFDTLSTTSDPFLEGRINVNQARKELLVGLPSMTEELANAIIAAQAIDADGRPLDDVIQGHSTNGWLYTQGLVDIWGMRDLDPFLTARGDVYRAQVLGFYDGGGPVARAEVIVDATQQPPRIIFHRDLNELGRGYTRAQIFTPAQ